MTRGERKTEMITIRVTSKDYETLSKQASEKGISVTQHARNIILNNMIQSVPSGDITEPEDVLKICKMAMNEFLNSDEFKSKQKALIRETLSEMAKGE